MTPEQLESLLKEANLAVENARDVRAYHRKRTVRGDAQRETDLKVALERVKTAMGPLRSEIGRFSRSPATDVIASNQESIRGASLALQRERRKLWKMLDRKERNS